MPDALTCMETALTRKEKCSDPHGNELWAAWKNSLRQSWNPVPNVGNDVRSRENTLKLHSPSFFELNLTFPWWGISNEILCILLAHGPAKLLEVKAGGMEENLGLKPGSHSSGANLAERQNFFLDLQLWHLAVLQSLELQECKVSHLKVPILEQMD